MLRSWRRPYGFWIMASNVRVEAMKKWGKPSCCFPYHPHGFCASRHDQHEHFSTDQGMNRVQTKTVKEVTLSHPIDRVGRIGVIKGTTHRDGAIYSNFGHLKWLRLTERFETWLEPMQLSEPADGCYPSRERCEWHSPQFMMQVFSLRLAQIPIDRSSIELYGYIAARDCLDSLLNYIVNRSRDDPVTLQQGSLIEMTGPKRGISMSESLWFEFDMRIKKGEKEEDDLQLIDGATVISELFTHRRPYTTRIDGEAGAVDITLGIINSAVEATIEVVISEVQRSFSLSLSSFVLVLGLHEEIQLFRGTICGPRALRRFVVAVEADTMMHLKFKIGQEGSKNDIERYFSFKATNHGCAVQQIMIDDAAVSAKVTWSAMPY